MKFANVAEFLKGIPYISPERGRQLYDFLLASNAHDVLELGFAHGVSTCYMAAALDELGSGRITTIDNVEARGRKPNLIELLERTGLGPHVEPVYGPQSYTWELMRLIERSSRRGVCVPIFDFCFIDGAHTWDADGLAFFLVDKLLRPGGWLLFDDLDWRQADDPEETAKPWVQPLPEDMKTTAQVGKIFALLVCQHPDYGDFRVDTGWGWARKIADSNAPSGAAPEVLDRIYGRPTIRRDAYLLSRRVAARFLGRARRRGS